MSGNLCLRSALRASSTSSGSGRQLLSASSQSLRLHGAGGLLPSNQPSNRTASRQYATTSAAPSTAPAPSGALVDPSQLLTTELVESTLVAKKERERLERIVRKHLDHMSDPWKIAQYVEDALRKDRFDEALLLTQKASKDSQVVVAWNHLIDHQLANDCIKPAIRLFNEMKKRGQLPNVQTFTIIFRGCARSKHPKLAIAEAMKHYNILLSDARLQPNSTHLNAVLNVCSRAGDLDSLFLAAESINDSTRAPTAYTYTTIFNALRYHAIQNAKDLSEEERQKNIQKAIDRAKSIWTEVIDKWRRGRLLIDEELVCAMSRLLLLSRSRDEKRSILDLLQQTMNIPNLTATITTTSTTLDATTPIASPIRTHDPHSDPLMRDIAVSGSPIPVPGSSSAAVYAIPGRNTLALICTILASAKLTTCGIKYWNLIVRHYGVVPDHDNWLRLFGMLKVARASAHAASILDILPDAHARASPPLPFRIAMETCVRDNINPNAVANATLVLDAMLRRLPVPDLLTLRLYLRVALVSHYQMREKAQEGYASASAAKREYGKQIIAALDRLWDPYKRTHYHYFKASSPNPQAADTTTTTKSRSPSGSSSSSSSSPPLGELYNNKREVIALARQMFSAFNKVANEHMLPADEIRRLRSLNAKINREIQAFFSNRDDIEPNIRGRSGKGRLTADNDRSDRRDWQEGDLTLGKEDKHCAAEEEGEGDAEVIVKRGGDFIWNTTKPVEIITRRERRQRESEEWGASRRTRDDASRSRDSRHRA